MFRFEFPRVMVPRAGVPSGLSAGALLPAYGDGHMDWGDGGFVAMWITMAVFWLAVVAIAAWAVSVYARKSAPAAPSALEIAKARLARGEITAEEFERLREALR